MATTEKTVDLDIEAVVDYCQYRVGDGLYAAYSYDEENVKQEYKNVGLEETQQTNFEQLVDELHHLHKQLSETSIKNQKSMLSLHESYCVVQLVFTTTRGLILFFDESLATKHSSFVDECLDEAT